MMSTISSLLSRGAELARLRTTARTESEQTMSGGERNVIYRLGFTEEIFTVCLLEYFLVEVPLQLILRSKKTLPESNTRFAVSILTFLISHETRHCVTWLMS